MQTLQIRMTKELVKKAQELADQGLYANKSEVVRDALRRLIYDKKLKIENERKFIIIFSSDLHGNIVQYKKLFSKSYEDKADAVIIGGDIAPKDSARRTIKSQRVFLEKKLVPLIKEFWQKNKKRGCACLTYLIMGNDDFKSNQKILEKHEKISGFRIIHNKRLKLHEGFDIVGYSYVPLTPFINKDWEKLDLENEDEHKKRKGFLTKGRKSRGNSFVKFEFDLDKRTNTIEKDMHRLLKKPKKTLMVIHSPPYNTALDLTINQEHVGSAAVRKIIQERQPWATLHGHIHESVNITGRYTDTIKKTVCISSGNDHNGKKLALIKFNLYKPEFAIREII